MLSTATPCHQRVAWAWLDKLIGQQPGRPPPPPVSPSTSTELPALKMTPREREHLLEQTYENIKKELISTIKMEIPKVERAEAQIASRHGIDPVFLDWFVMNPRNWPSMSSKQRSSLNALQNTFIWFAALPDDWRDMVVPDLDQIRDRDQALRELADWFVKNTVATVARKYVNLIWKHSRALMKAFRGPGAPSDPKASLLLMRDFKRRLLADRFQLQPSVQQIVDLFD